MIDRISKISVLDQFIEAKFLEYIVLTEHYFINLSLEIVKARMQFDLFRNNCFMSQTQVT